MGSVGFSEMVLIGIVALLVYGDRLPYVARDVGRFVEKMRRQFMDIKWEINRAIDIEEAAARPPEPPALSEPTPPEAPAETQEQAPVTEATSPAPEAPEPAPKGGEAAPLGPAPSTVEGPAPKGGEAPPLGPAAP